MKRSLFVRTVPMPSRKEILGLYEEGLSTREIATRFQISESWTRRVKQEHREQGKTRNATTRNRQPKWAPLVPEIKQALADQPDLTLKELKAKLQTELDVGTLCRALQKLKLTLKKSPESVRAGSSGRGPTTGRVENSASQARSRSPRLS